MNKIFSEAWAYIVEVVLCSLLFAGSLVLWEKESILKFITTSSSDIASYFSVVMLGGAIAFFWVFYSKSDTPFANWLYKKGAYRVYIRAYLTTIGIYAFLTCSLLLAKSVNNEYVALATYWLLILGLVNLYSFFKNISSQLRLNMEFNKIYNNKS